GAAVEFVTEPLDNSPEGQLIRYIRGYAAKVEHEKIKERSIRGTRARAEAGKLLTGPRPLYGYLWNADRSGYLVDPATAPIVQRIFAAAARGETLHRVAQTLTAEGIPTRLGRPFWQRFTLHTILTNPTYTGRATAYRTRATHK